jgi:CRISPR-associated endonuclease/helicase Cas3
MGYDAMNLLELLLFWAKSEGSEQEPPFHPILYHLIDVAAAAEAILQTETSRIKRIAARLHVDPAALSTVMIRLIALHDIGKFSRAFQAKRPDLWPSILGAIEPRAPDIPHTDIGFQLLTHDNFEIYPMVASMLPAWRRALAMRLVAAVSGHHGEPADETPRFDSLHVIGPCCAVAARTASEEMLRLWEPPVLTRLGERDVAILSWALAGLTVLADWIGSNRKWFPSVAPGPSLLDYLNDHARPNAHRAVQDAGLHHVPPAPFTEFRELFPAIDKPTPVQDFAQHVSLPRGPVLVLVEDATSSGKTEASLFLAHRLMKDRGSHGLYIALPTMATANAMFSRLQTAYRSLFNMAEVPSLVLAHGRRRLHPGFRDSILDQPDQANETSHATNSADVPAAAFCAAWIADDRRKAFLADVGVGTIDQALLAVLPSRHQSLRLWGLADRVLIVDEAHAYDPYMARELETLLEFQSALGGSAIVLSATLPNATRVKIINAFQRGLGQPPSVETAHSAYPLVTVVGRHEVHEHPTGLRPQLVRSVVVKRLEATEQAVVSICDALTKGAAALWVRNTVDEAISAVELLREAGAQPMLFHARFAMGDRLAIEEKVLSLFGRERPQRYPRGAVLVATQVVEQSLDLDFDLVVSDLAPIDLLIQRAGRLWRHMDRRPLTVRPSSEPQFLVLSPDPTDDAPADWIRRPLPGTAAVYPDPKLLWTSMKALVHSGAIVTAEMESLETAAAGNVR